MRGEVRDDLYSDGREVTVDSEQAEDPDEVSELEEEVKNEGNPLVSSGSICGRENTGGLGTATEARRRSWYSGFLGVACTLGRSFA